MVTVSGRVPAKIVGDGYFQAAFVVKTNGDLARHADHSLSYIFFITATMSDAPAR